jgi:hypothetical protein
MNELVRELNQAVARLPWNNKNNKYVERKVLWPIKDDIDPLREDIWRKIDTPPE